MQSAKLPRVAIYQTNAQGQCIYVNSVLCEMFEMTEQDALGTGWMDRVHPDDRERVAEGRQHATSPRPFFQLDYRLNLPSGKTIWVAAFSTALMEGGKFKGRIGTLTDITEAKKHEAGPNG